MIWNFLVYKEIDIESTEIKAIETPGFIVCHFKCLKDGHGRFEHANYWLFISFLFKETTKIGDFIIDWINYFIGRREGGRGSKQR